jgi:hypothetical protein
MECDDEVKTTIPYSALDPKPRLTSVSNPIRLSPDSNLNLL